MTKELICLVHTYHWPPTREVQLHHIWPLGMGGPDQADNKVAICPTGHRNVHRAIRDLIDGFPPVATSKEKKLAQSGFDQWVAANRPGHPEIMGAV